MMSVSNFGLKICSNTDGPSSDEPATSHQRTLLANFNHCIYVV